MNSLHCGLFAQVSDAKDLTERVLSENVTRLQQAFEPVVRWIPSVLAMLVVFVIGYVVAVVLSRLAAALCDKLGMQKAVERSGLADSMRQVGIRRTAPAIMGQVAFWLVMCTFLMAGFDILQLQALSTALHGLVAYIPKLVIATAVVVIGLVIANFLRGVIATSADRIGVSYAERLATAVYFLLAMCTFIAAFEQLQIKFDLLGQMILIAFGGLSLGVGLAIGFGGRDVVGGILAGYYTRQRLQAGDRVSVAGLEGTVREVGAVATVIETDEGGMTNRHTVPNTKMLNEAVR